MSTNMIQTRKPMVMSRLHVPRWQQYLEARLDINIATIVTSKCALTHLLSSSTELRRRSTRFTAISIIARDLRQHRICCQRPFPVIRRKDHEAYK